MPLRLSYAWQRWFHNAAAHCLVPTASIEHELGRRGFQNLRIWTRGVDRTLFRPQPEADLGLARPVFAYVGRLAVEKGIDAFLGLDLPGSKLVVGDGPARKDLERRFPQAYFVGAKQGDLAYHYAAADAFVFPSRTDTFGLVLLVKPKLPKNSFNFYWVYAIILVLVLLMSFFDFNSPSNKTNWQEFETKMLRSGDVERLVVVNKENAEVYIKQEALSKEQYKDLPKKSWGSNKNLGPHYTFEIGPPEAFEKKLQDAQVGVPDAERISVDYITQKNWGGDLFGWIFPIVVMIAIWMFIMRRMTGGSGGGNAIFNIGKSRAALFDPEDKIKITFADVAGLEEAKEEVMEIVDFLKNPQKFTTLGGKIPKGALLVGTPGTGKTLLAKAVAGEAGVPFFSLSGSDFVEMFVGVGASRVRDLFNQVDQGVVAGIFTERDAVFRVLACQLAPTTTKVREVMTPHPLMLPPEATYGLAMTAMDERGFRHIPVVENGAVIGMVTARNALDPELEEFVTEVRRREHWGKLAKEL